MINVRQRYSVSKPAPIIYIPICMYCTFVWSTYILYNKPLDYLFWFVTFTS